MPLLSTRGSGALSSSGFSFGENIGVSYWFGAASLISDTSSAGVKFDGRVCIDNSENIYSYGGYTNTPYDGIYTPLIIKINKDGVLQWQRNIDASGFTGSGTNTITTDVNGNVYVGGAYLVSGTHYNALIAKYSTSGTFQWVRALSTTTDSEGVGSIYTDSSANVYVTGTMLGGNFFAKYNTTGTLQWQRILNVDFLSGLFVDASGNIYVCGYTGATDNFYVAKLDGTPAILWQKTFAVGSGISRGRSIYVDASGNIYVSGTMPVSSGGAITPYIAKLDNNGNILWQSTFTTGSSTTDQEITRDSFGNLYVLSNRRISKFADSGDFLWQRSIAGMIPYGITSTNSGNLILSGYSSLSTSGYGFIHKLPGNGPSLLGSYRLTSPIFGGGFIDLTYAAQSSTVSPGVATSATASATLSTSTLTASTPSTTTATPTTTFFIKTID